jgi:hypothetical protein
MSLYRVVHSGVQFSFNVQILNVCTTFKFDCIKTRLFELFTQFELSGQLGCMWSRFELYVSVYKPPFVCILLTKVSVCISSLFDVVSSLLEPISSKRKSLGPLKSIYDRLVIDIQHRSVVECLMADVWLARRLEPIEMNTWRIATVILMLAAVSGQARAQFWTGNKLVEELRKSEQTTHATYYEGRYHGICHGRC